MATIRSLKRMTNRLYERLDALLPQTQCTRCGFPACRPYADAMAIGEADIDRCPPGGADGIAALASVLGRAPKPLDPAYGIEAPPTVAVIDEAACIGCTLCIQACPVDAIVGAAKRMHAVIAAECTGCDLCVAPCPVDCITMQAIADAPLSHAAVLERAVHARARYEARKRRLDSELAARETRRRGAGGGVEESTAAPPITRNAVLEAIARGRAKRQRSIDDTSSP